MGIHTCHLWRLRLEDHEFEANWGYLVKSCLKNPKPSKGKWPDAGK
jgi:hypothetical protein